MQLRPYQYRAIQLLYGWFRRNNKGHPVIDMPGGSGKSLVIAALVKDALQNWPQTRVLMLVHSKELISQNSIKLRTVWPNAPLGIYSASLNKRKLGEPITYAGIGSVRNRATQIGHIDICIVDEAHAISNTETGTYRKLINDLIAINPSLRVIGLTASPYRLGQGRVTDGDKALFSEILEPTSIEELIYKGWLYPLQSKNTDHKLETKGLHKRQGEYIGSEMQERFNTDDHNIAVVDEIIRRGENYRHWLIFCAGIEHSEAIVAEFQRQGIVAASLTSRQKRAEREQILADFESGRIQAVCNVGILTTGYDFPDIDLIVFLRATASPGLYTQMAMRGTRPKSHINHCRVLDFAGNVRQHGPITAVQAPDAKAGDGEAPIKACPQCDELVHLSLRQCPECGYEFPLRADREGPKLYGDDIMGMGGHRMAVGSWAWRPHTSRSSGKDMVKVTYYPAELSGKPITEYLPVLHGGIAGQKAVARLAEIAHSSGATLPQGQCSMAQLAEAMQAGKPPGQIHYKMEGKWPRVEYREWEDQNAALA